MSNQRNPQKILVIEDDPQVARLLKITLERQGFAVHHAENGKEGVRYLHENQEDVKLVITDIIMPEMDGLETIKEIGSSVKILAISGGGRIGPEGYLKTARLLGADLTLQKPFQRKELLEAIDQLLSTPKN